MSPTPSSRAKAILFFALYFSSMAAFSQPTPAQEYQRLFGSSDAGLSITTSEVTLTYRSQTKNSVFSYMQKPSWDVTAVLTLKNATPDSMAIVGLDGAFSVGACSPHSAEGISKTLSGVGTIDPNYLQPNYPYALPTGSFTQLPPNGSLSIKIVLQGCSIESFDGDKPDVAISVSLAALSPRSRLARKDAVSSKPKVQVFR